MAGINMLFLLGTNLTGFKTGTKVVDAQQKQPSSSMSPSDASTNSASSPLGLTPNNKAGSDGRSIVIGVVVGVVGSIIILSAIGAIWIRRRASNQAPGRQLDPDRMILKGDPISPVLAEKYDPFQEVKALASKFKIPNSPDCINKVKLLDLIGGNALGQVYRGRWRELDVAVKTVIFSRRKGSGDGQEKRAIMEAVVTYTMEHPNIVATYHFDIKRVENLQGIEGAIQIEDSSCSDWKLYLIQVK